MRFYGIFPSWKQNFIVYRSSKVSSRPDWIFKIHQLWPSGFSWVYSNSCCSSSFEPEVIKIGQMYCNNILFQESPTILNGCTKKVWKFIECTTYLFHHKHHHVPLAQISLTFSRHSELTQGVMVKATDCGIIVSEIKFLSRYYVHFRANTLGKVWTPLSSQLWVK